MSVEERIQKIVCEQLGVSQEEAKLEAGVETPTPDEEAKAPVEETAKEDEATGEKEE